jgi:DNA mismatch endonuclease (patch repair protein)
VRDGDTSDVLLKRPIPSTAHASAVMRGNRGRDTGPELALRRVLHARGLRYRVNHPIRPDSRRLIRVDLAFPKTGVAVLVDGCYWHACPVHGTVPKGNARYWMAKLTSNAARDRETTTRLEALGWTVVRVWEHEVPDPAEVRILLALDRQRRETHIMGALRPSGPMQPAGRF